jgi:hypothetical protein
MISITYREQDAAMRFSGRVYTIEAAFYTLRLGLRGPIDFVDEHGLPPLQAIRLREGDQITVVAQEITRHAPDSGFFDDVKQGAFREGDPVRPGISVSFDVGRIVSVGRLFVECPIVDADALHTITARKDAWARR